jgi:hypothetical protein
MSGTEAFRNDEVVTRSPEASFDSVADRADIILAALDEALDSYPEVTLPNGEAVEAVDEHERLVAKAQRLLEGIQGLREQVTAKDEYHAERAVAMVEDAVAAITEYLSVRADLLNEVHKNPSAARLVSVLDRISETLIPEVSARTSREEQYLIEKKVA